MDTTTMDKDGIRYNTTTASNVCSRIEYNLSKNFYGHKTHIHKNNIMNLSNTTLTDTHKTLLNLGMSFILTVNSFLFMNLLGVTG